MFIPNHLLIQTEDGVPSEEGAAFIEACRQQNWLDGADTWAWSLVRAEDLVPGFEGSGIPVGSVEFVSRFLALKEYPSLKALNVPQELRSVEFLHRRVFEFPNKRALLGCLRGCRGKDLLLKPGGMPKLFQATTTGYMDEIPEDEPIFASEILESPIESEWRVFVLRGEVRGIRPYVLQGWVFPDRALVQAAAQKIKTSSCTLDFAVLKNGDTVLLEAHPFIACGLYGFSGTDLLRMAKVAWREQLTPVEQALAERVREAEAALSRVMESRYER